MRRLLWVSGVALVGCLAGPRAVPRAQLEVLAARSYDGAFDEVFDATQLGCGQLGLEVVALDDAQGTFEARRADGTGYRVAVRTLNGAQQVIAWPSPEHELVVLEGPQGERARWDELEQRTRALLETWREPPEWRYVPERNLVAVLDFQTVPPREWKRIEPSVSRRELVVQEQLVRRGFNPTMQLVVERRRPRVDPVALLADTAGLALGAKRRLTWPENTKGRLDDAGVHGDAEVLDGSVPRRVSWHLLDLRSDAWVVRVAAVCDAEVGCDAAFRALAGSTVAPGFRAGLAAPRHGATGSDHTR